MGLRCKGCGGEEHVKNGFMRGKQRYRCKACGLNFTNTPPRGMPLRVKVEAVLLYLSGLSMNRTAKLLGVSTPSVQAGIVLRDDSSTGSWAVVTRPLASGCSSDWSAGVSASTAPTAGRPTPS